MNKRNVFFIVIMIALIISACEDLPVSELILDPPPHLDRWGIYSLNLNTQEVKLIYSTPDEITKVIFSPAAEKFVFAQKVGGDELKDDEIFTLGHDGQDLQRLTNNNFLDTYPAWSPDGTQIAYLAMIDSILSVYLMDADGGQPVLLYNSGFHDADIDWVGKQIAFTRNSQIWLMNSDGTDARQVTDPSRAGEWGNANLPFGDYDPRISSDGSRIVFERMVDDSSPHGNYEIFIVDIDGTNLIQITDTGYTQGLANWSRSGDELVFVITSIDDVGQYDIYMMNSDGTENRNITPESFPPEFLVHWTTFSADDALIYFIGEWWVEE